MRGKSVCVCVLWLTRGSEESRSSLFFFLLCLLSERGKLLFSLPRPENVLLSGSLTNGCLIWQ
jgi:hypothetical protein